MFRVPNVAVLTFEDVNSAAQVLENINNKICLLLEIYSGCFCRDGTDFVGE